MGPVTPRSEHRLFCRRPWSPCEGLEIRAQRDSSQDMGLNLHQAAQRGTGYLSPGKQTVTVSSPPYDPAPGLPADSSRGPATPDKHCLRDNRLGGSKVLGCDCGWWLRFLGFHFCLGFSLPKRCEQDKIPCRTWVWKWSNCVSFHQLFSQQGGKYQSLLYAEDWARGWVDKGRRLAHRPSGQSELAPLPVPLLLLGVTPNSVFIPAQETLICISVNA